MLDGEHTEPTEVHLGLQIDVLEQSFALLAVRADELGERLYDELFGRYPAMRPLFADTEIPAQRVHLKNALVLVVENLRNPDKLMPALKRLGEKYQITAGSRNTMPPLPIRF